MGDSFFRQQLYEQMYVIGLDVQLLDLPAIHLSALPE